MPFHITPTANVTRIMKEGLLPQQGERAAFMETEDGIYLFKTLEDVSDALGGWMDVWFDEEEKLALLEVELPPDAQTAPTSAEFEIVVSTPIPPHYIKILAQDIDESELSGV